MRTFIRKIYVKLPLGLVLFMVWLVLAGEYGLAVVLTGLSVVLIALLLLPEDAAEMLSPRLFGRGFHLLWFTLYALAGIFIASYKLVYFAFHPGISLQSSIFAHDFALESRLGVLLLSTVITLMPGTLVVDISEDRHRFYIHTLVPAAVGREQVRMSLQHIENRLRRVLG